uniref:Uncharacterized protein n=1 Tax=Candidatus Kentrum sp. LFY TaxID=2126342 RepID=A0A450UB23_9GAMM|nr:MAG: hypothetical protein BECKLFY1418A_GA0070994_100752 [Candidatus Kentron sp. LFY]
MSILALFRYHFQMEKYLGTENDLYGWEWDKKPKYRVLTVNKSGVGIPNNTVAAGL